MFFLKLSHVVFPLLTRSWRRCIYSHHIYTSFQIHSSLTKIKLELPAPWCRFHQANWKQWILMRCSKRSVVISAIVKTLSEPGFCLFNSWAGVFCHSWRKPEQNDQASAPGCGYPVMGTTCPYFKRSLRLGPDCSVISYAAPSHPSMPIPAEKEINTVVLSAKTPKALLHLPLALNSSWDGAWVIFSHL